MKAQNTSKRPYEFKNATKIIRLLKQGETSNYIMAECKCVSSTVSFYRRKLKLEPPSKEHQHKHLIKEALLSKMNWKYIAHLFGCSESTICRYNKELKANNINASIS